MPTTTTNLSLNKPVVGGDVNNWGTLLNDNFDALDELITSRTLADFDAVGDGVTDDSAVLDTAFAWLDAEKGRTLLGDPGATYLVTTALTLASRGTFDGQNCHIQVSDNVDALTADAGYDIYDLSADYTKDSLAISVASTGTALAPGTRIKIVSNATDPGNRDEGSSTNKYRVGEHVTVGIGSTAESIVLTRPLRFVRGISPTSTAGNEARIDAYTTAMNARVVVLDSTRQLKLKNFSLSYDDGEEATWSGRAITLRWCVRPELENVQVLRGYGAGVGLQGTVDASFWKCAFERLEDNTDNGQFGYGIADAGYGTRAIFCTASDCRHGYTTDAQNVAADYTSSVNIATVGRIVDAKVIGCLGKNFGVTGSAFDTHADGENVQFVDCTVVDCAGYAFTIRGRDNHITGPIIRNCGKGVHIFTGYSSGDTDDDFFVNGRALDDFTSATLTNADIQCEDEPILIRTARATINGGLRIRSATHRMVSASGLIEFSAVGSFEVTDFDTAMTLVDDDSTGVFDLDDVNTDATDAIAETVLTFTAAADIKVNATAAVSSLIRGIGLEGSSSAIVEGKLEIDFPASGTVFAFTPNQTMRPLVDGRYTVKRGGTVTRIYSERLQFFVLADDAVEIVLPPDKSGIVSVVTSQNANFPPNGALGVIAFDAGSSAAAEKSAAFSAFGGDLTATTGVLAGTTGTDGDLTVSAHTDGNLYVENRLGEELTFQLQFS